MSSRWSSVTYRRDALTINGGGELSSYYVARVAPGRDAKFAWNFPEASRVYLNYRHYTRPVKIAKYFANRDSHTIEKLSKTQEGYIVLVGKQNELLRYFRFKVLVR